MWLAFFILILLAAGVAAAFTFRGRGRAYAIAGVVALLILMLAGCAATAEPLTPKNIQKHAQGVGDAVGQMAVTGNPLPVLLQSLSFGAFIVGGVGAAIAAKKNRELQERKRPWSEEERRAFRAAQSVAHSPTLPSAQAQDEYGVRRHVDAPERKAA